MNTDQKKRLSELLNGTGTRYAVILEALRNNLHSEIQSIAGCLAFYNFDKGNTDNMLMKVFPYNPDVINFHFPSDLKIQIEVLERINADRKYTAMHHLKNFRNKYNSKAHFNITIPDREVLVYDKKEINGRSWTAFTKDNSIENNIFDNLLFCSEEKSFQIYPLPVLSSPCMLLILPASEHIISPDIVAARIRESVDFYLYNRLLNEISKDLKPGLINNKKCLIERFLLELSQVAIPIKYEFNGNCYNCFDWYGNWKDEDSYNLELSLDGEPVKIIMPTFCWFSGIMIHQTQYFNVKAKQVVETIQNIFLLVHNHWQIINSKKLLMQNEISPLINELKHSAEILKGMKVHIEDKITEQSQKVEMLSKLVVELGGDISQPFENEFYSITKSNGDKVWKIRYKGVDVIEGAEDKGFEGLHCIFYNKEVDVEELGADGNYIEQKINDTDIKKTWNDYKQQIDQLEKDLRNNSLPPDYEGLSQFAISLAGYINCCKDLGISYTAANSKLIQTKIPLKEWMGERDFSEFERMLSSVAKQTRPNSLSKKEKDKILNNIRNLISKLEKEQDGILAPLLDESVLKIGVKCSYHPTGELDVIWRFTKVQTD